MFSQDEQDISSRINYMTHKVWGSLSEFRRGAGVCREQILVDAALLSLCLDIYNSHGYTCMPETDTWLAQEVVAAVDDVIDF